MRLSSWVAFVLLAAMAGCPGPKPGPVSTRRIAMPVFTEQELEQAEPLDIVAAVPTGTVEQRTEASEVAVTFDAPMVALEAVSDSVDFPLLLNPDVPGSCHWLGTRTVVFRPDTALPVATGFTARVPRGVRSLEGRMLKADYVFEFETVRPRLENSRPYHDEGMVELAPELWLKFNVPMDPKRASRYLELLADDGTRTGLAVRLPRRGEQPSGVWWYDSEDSAYTLVLRPTRRLRIQTGYTVVVGAGLLAREGNLGAGQEEKLSFRTFNRFDFEQVSGGDALHPEDALELSFTNPVPHDRLIEHIRFKPAVKLPAERYDYATSHHYLYLDLAPETDYELTLSKWLTDRFGNRLGRNRTLRLRTGSYRPRVTMPAGRGIVETGDKLRHPVWMVNVESVAVGMRRLDASEVIPFWRTRYEYYYDYDEDGSADGKAGVRFSHTRTWKPKLARNRRTLLPLDLAPGLGGRRSGFLFCELDMLFEPERGTRYQRAFLQVSPYGLTAKFSPENGLAWVTRLADCSAGSEVFIELRDDANRVVWNGRTDTQGFVAFPGWAGLGVRPRHEWSSPRVWLFARGSEGEAFVHSEWGTGVGPYEFGLNYDWSPDPAEPVGFIFTEKGLYKAGDSVRVKGIVRYKKRGRWVFPSRRDGEFRVTDARGEDVLERRVAINDRGGFDVAVGLADDATSGYYQMVFEQNDYSFYGSFRVEAYRPAEFEVLVRADKNEYVAGDVLDATVSGRYLSGAAMSGQSANWSLALSPTDHTPAGWDGYSFGPQMDETQDETGVLGSGTGRLDAEGRLALKGKLDLGRRTSSCLVTCEATVTAPNEREISGRESYLVHRADRYVGVKLARGFVEVGDSVGLDIVAAAPSGETLRGAEVTVTVFRRVWRSARKAQTGGRYGWLSEKLDEKAGGFKVRTGDGPARRWFKPTRPGQYWFKCETRDRRKNPARTDVAFWVAGKGEASWMMRDDDVLELVRDKAEYRPGDTAKILVKSPWTGVKALVTIERELILDRFTTEVNGNAELIRVPIREEYLPNVFVSVALLKGRTSENSFGEQGEDLGKPAFKLGYVELPVNPQAKKLTVEVKTGQDEYRPGEEVTLDVTVTGPGKDPAQAEVTLAVVDLGVLKLIGYRTPDPFRVFYAPRPLSVATAESRLHVIGRRNYGEKGEAAGGDGWAGEDGRNGYDFAYREKFLETALWLPAVRTDAAGRARATFTLPDNITTWQVIAVAATEERFGSGEATFRSDKPLQLSGSLPRFIRPDDRFSAGVVAHNRTDRPLVVALGAACSGGAAVEGEAKKRVTVAPNVPLEVTFDFRCIGGSAATFEFTASAEGERDALRMTLPVRSPYVTEAVALYEQTLDTLARQTVSAPADAFAGVGGLELTLSSSGLAGLERGLEYLRTYPYECLEQRMSKVLPFIVGEELINTFGLSELRGDGLRRFVQAELDLVSKYQDESGGFHFWSGFGAWSRPSPYLSGYTMYVLALAQRAGYRVSAPVADRGRSYLANWLAYGTRAGDWPYSRDEELTTRALAVHSLALWGATVEPHVNNLAGSLDKMSVFGRAHLLRALALMPGTPVNAELAARIIRSMENKLKLSPTTAHYEEDDEGGWLFHSNVRTTAFMLEALLASRGEIEFAEKAVKWLVSERKSGRWRTTQENAHVFAALAEFYRVYEKTRPDFTATALIEGRTVLSRTFSGRSLGSERRFIPLDSLGSGARSFELAKRGEGRVYYGLRLTYAPKGELKPREEGIRVEKTITPTGKARGFVRGDEYLVTLKVHTPQDRLYVVVDDPLPAGLEIVNTTFATEKQASSRALERAGQGGYRWWGSFDHESIHDDRYVLFASYLEKGVHTRSYLVRALTRGRFLMPPATAEEMYTPEVFGRAGQQVVEVK